LYIGLTTKWPPYIHDYNKPIQDSIIQQTDCVHTLGCYINQLLKPLEIYHFSSCNFVNCKSTHSYSLLKGHMYTEAQNTQL